MNFDLSPYVPYVYNQLGVGACVPNAICQALNISGEEYGVTYDLSRLQIYNDARLAEHTFNVDSGVIPWDAYQVTMTVGIMQESDFPYNPALTSKATLSAFYPTEKVLSVNTLPHSSDWTVTRDEIQGQIMQGKAVLVSTNNLTFADGYQINGGHQLLAVGFNDSTQQYKVLNSWGNQWADGGYSYVDYKEFSGADSSLLEIDTFNGFGNHDYRWTSERIEAASYYPAIFGRTGDYAGVDFWATQLTHGLTEEQVISEFLRSPEYLSLYGDNLSTSGFINAEYQHILGRSPDPEGSHYWSDLLVSGVSQAEQIAAFLNAAEQTGDSAYVNNRTHVSMYGAITFQDDGTHLQADRIALVGVTSDPNTIQPALNTLHDSLYGV